MAIGGYRMKKSKQENFCKETIIHTKSIIYAILQSRHFLGNQSTVSRCCDCHLLTAIYSLAH